MGPSSSQTWAPSSAQTQEGTMFHQPGGLAITPTDLLVFSPHLYKKYQFVFSLSLISPPLLFSLPLSAGSYNPSRQDFLKVPA